MKTVPLSLILLVCWLNAGFDIANESPQNFPVSFSRLEYMVGVTEIEADDEDLVNRNRAAPYILRPTHTRNPFPVGDGSFWRSMSHINYNNVLRGIESTVPRTEDPVIQTSEREKSPISSLRINGSSSVLTIRDKWRIPLSQKHNKPSAIASRIFDYAIQVPLITLLSARFARNNELAWYSLALPVCLATTYLLRYSPYKMLAEDLTASSNNATDHQHAQLLMKEHDNYNVESTAWKIVFYMGYSTGVLMALKRKRVSITSGDIILRILGIGFASHVFYSLSTGNPEQFIQNPTR